MQFTQAPLEIENQSSFAQLKAAIDEVFAPQATEDFLRRLKKNNLRARDFAGVLQKKLLKNPSVAEIYAQLSFGDQGQIREHYLLQVEKVAPQLREKFKQVFAYY